MSPDVSTHVWGALMPGITAHPVEPWVAELLAQGVRAVCLFDDAGGTPDRTRETVQQLRALSPDLVVAADEEGGEITRLQARTGSSFLSPSALGAIADLEVTRATGRLIGRMLRSVGVDWTLAPLADVRVVACSQVTGVRSFSEHASVAAAHVEAFITAIQSTGVIATAKHFPGHGDTQVDSHDSLPTLSTHLDLLRQRELLPFRSAIGAGVGSVMTGHLLSTALDAESPASMSRAITSGLLRGELGFGGVVITDAFDMGAMSGSSGGRLPHPAVASLLAGADLVCLGSADQERATESAANAIFRALADGTLDPAVLIAAADRRAQLRTSRNQTPEPAGVERDEDLVAGAAHRSLLVRGDARLIRSGVDVLRLTSWPTHSVDASAWSVGSHLSALGLDVKHVDAAPALSDRDLVVEVRDVWERAELLDALAAAARSRPDAVMVDVGVPTPAPPQFRGSITTHGVGSLSAALAACRLTGGDPRPAALAVLRAARGEVPHGWS